MHRMADILRDEDRRREQEEPASALREAARAFARSGTLGFLNRSEQQREALQRVREWTRVRFALPAEASIVVTELACAVPGCPPLETVVAFWIDERRHHFKVFKSAAQVIEEDLPPTWLLPSLAVPEGFDCDCC
jgi:nitrate reductase delta subunit